MLYFLSILALCTAVSTATPSISTVTTNKAYIVSLSPGADSISRRRDAIDHLQQFHKRAGALEYSVRHEFRNSDVFLGLSIEILGNSTDEDAITQIRAIPNVLYVAKVQKVRIPVINGNKSVQDPLLSYSKATKSPKVATGVSNLASSLEMGGVDKLHKLGIKGKGIRIGIVDTGVDYRHPALGAGFGSGYKIAGGYRFTTDNGTLANGPDPISTCYGGGHGTHVTGMFSPSKVAKANFSGIVGMNSVPESFQFTGVAPEASIYMYRVFDCNGNAGSDTVLAAMSKAQEDGVDIVSMSLGIGSAAFDGDIDPLAAVTKILTDAGIAVVVANGNDASGSSQGGQLYTEEWPSSEPTTIAVGAISNSHFPLVYSATDSLGDVLQYASIYSVPVSEADVYLVGDPCDYDSWTQAIAATANLNNTIFAFQTSNFCPATSAGNWDSSKPPIYTMAINSPSTAPYAPEYDLLHQGFFGTVEMLNMNAADGATLIQNYNSLGGYGKYKLSFNSSLFESIQQASGGMVDYYSSFGPTWHEYGLKPQISAPGGHILSTWPLGPLGGYSILSGTSMATPYVAACYALVKSQFPTESLQQIKDRLQANAQPVPWIFDKTILSATPQQGAGLINCYNAIYSETTISPGQLIISDVSKTEYGTANITITNASPATKTYKLSHQGAGYMDYYIPYGELNQVNLYGTAIFGSSDIVVSAGQSKTIPLSIKPPNGVVPSNLPVFGGFIQIISGDEALSIPYVGPPYSLYNTPQILIQPLTNGFTLPEVYAYDANGNIIYDTGILDFNSSWGFGGTIPTLQITRAIRIDAVPADTSLTADHYGFDRNVSYDYILSAQVPKENIFGHASYGTLINETGYLWPSGNDPFGTAAKVATSTGTSYTLGIGDYRWYGSVLRWGGTPGVQEDYETWLGPVVRFVT